MIILDGKCLLKIHMFLLLNKSVSVHKPLEIHHQNIWQFLKEMSLVRFHSAAILLVALHVDVLKIVVKTLLDGALVVRDVQRQNETRVEGDRAVSGSFHVELVTDDSAEDVSNYTVFYVA